MTTTSRGLMTASVPQEGEAAMRMELGTHLEAYFSHGFKQIDGDCR